MIGRHCSVAILVLFSALSSATVQADWAAFPKSVGRDVARRQAWPRPFVGPDQESVCAPFDVMVCNGWRRQNTLADYHFDQNGQLNEAGRLKVQWIVLEAPEQHRAVFVYRGVSAQETGTRLAGVAQYVNGLVGPNVTMPPVLETGVPAPSSRGDYAVIVDTKFIKSIPDPKLPALQGSGGVSGVQSQGGGATQSR
jgi:hypothetical protein